MAYQVRKCHIWKWYNGSMKAWMNGELQCDDSSLIPPFKMKKPPVKAVFSYSYCLYCRRLEMLSRVCGICGKTHAVGEACPLASNRHKEYDRCRRNRDSASFYHSRQWRAIHDYVLHHANYIDQYAYAIEHVVKRGNLVHHIYPLREHPEMGTALGNLVCVSSESHNKIHTIYDKGESKKKKLQAKLQTIVESWGKG